MSPSFQNNGDEGSSGQSSWSRCFCEGANLGGLLMPLERTHGDQRTVLLHYHHLGCAIAQAHHQLEQVRASEALSRKVCYRWSEELDSGDHSLKNSPRSEAPERGYSELCEQILRMVCESDRKRPVLREKLFVVPFMRTAKTESRLSTFFAAEGTRYILLLDGADNIQRASFIIAQNEKWTSTITLG